MADFILESLQGGVDDFTPKSALPKDACELAENVEFFRSTLGERRAGTITHPDLPAGITGNASFGGICWMFRHEPTTKPLEAELWVMTFDTGNVNPRVFRYRIADSWTEITFRGATDKPALTNGQGYRIYGQSFHGKLFLAYVSSLDRLHVYEEVTDVIRPAGIAAMAAPTVANGGGAGAYPATLRYYRTRGIIMDGSTVLVRSEPSTSTSFTPSGVNANATVTRGSFVESVETHWEVEVSLDNTLFYRLSTVVAATTTYADSAATTTYSSNPQSDPIGSYTLIPCVQFLAVDNDRLLMAGADETIALSVGSAADLSAVRWTPPGTDPLPGADERLDATTDPRLDLDGAEGGGLTGLSQATNGVVIATKWNAIYKILRTGELVGAYDAKPVTKLRGALPRSLVVGCDEEGNPALFLADPVVGPMRLGASGLLFLGHGINTLWRTVNVSATVPIHGVFYGDKQQLHYWVASSTDIVENFPTAKIVLQTNLVSVERGARRGWTTVPVGDDIAAARCSVMYYSDDIFDSSNTGTHFVPYIAKQTAASAIRICDSGTTDNGTAYTGRARSRAFFLADILNRFGLLNAAVLGKKNTSVTVKLIRDFGAESLSKTLTFTPTVSEEFVPAMIDDLTLAELFALQIEFSDNPSNVTQWELLQFVAKQSPEQTG